MTVGRVAIEIIWRIEERIPGSSRWTLLNHLRPSTEEETDETLSRLRRAMPESEFRKGSTRYDPTGVEDDDIPF